MGGINVQQRLRQALPGPARNVISPELAGQFVEIRAHLVLPAA